MFIYAMVLILYFLMGMVFQTGEHWIVVVAAMVFVWTLLNKMEEV